MYGTVSHLLSETLQFQDIDNDEPCHPGTSSHQHQVPSLTHRRRCNDGVSGCHYPAARIVAGAVVFSVLALTLQGFLSVCLRVVVLVIFFSALLWAVTIVTGMVGSGMRNEEPSM